MSGRIFLLDGDRTLRPMAEQPYDSEDLLQALLADYPDLLAGDQIDDLDPRRWLLIRREFGVPDAEDAGNRWSVDHLFLDQDGVPTLVEVKRSSDTRIRREVVGQILDYAAHAAAYWPADRIRAAFEAACEKRGAAVDEELAEFLGAASGAEDFWEKVRSNLGAGRLRLVLVADRIPRELQRVVEFLNKQMDPAEVLAVEIRQFVADDRKTLVPRVMGLTAEATEKKVGKKQGRQWDEASFFKDLAARRDAEVVEVAREIYSWSKSNADTVAFGRSKRLAGFIPRIWAEGRNRYLFELWSSGWLETYFQWHAYCPPFDDDEKRRELLRRYNAIPGVELPEDAINRRPSFDLAALVEPERLRQLLAVVEWVIGEMRSGDG